ncbi:hypothetical protein [Rhizorhabdus wittichii]|uniref:hypothetical protein n=1 Tax=Rhizorhabdus wittichii TaxID=160791 RepID=UPI001D016952|nr:hypothetical protein [Rhizorhabdus wittichii]
MLEQLELEHHLGAGQPRVDLATPPVVDRGPVDERRDLGGGGADRAQAQAWCG